MTNWYSNDAEAIAAVVAFMAVFIAVIWCGFKFEAWRERRKANDVEGERG